MTVPVVLRSVEVGMRRSVEVRMSIGIVVVPAIAAHETDGLCAVLDPQTGVCPFMSSTLNQ